MASSAASGCALAPPMHVETNRPTSAPATVTKRPSSQEVQQASFDSPADRLPEPPDELLPQPSAIVALPEQSPSQATSADAFCPQVYPIDLLTALRLANGSNLQLMLARERITQAWARNDGARALWLPSLRGGVNYSRHDNQIQDTMGQVFPISRGSMFSGLGAGSVPAGPPMFPGIYANFKLADAIFQPLATRQAALARRHAATAATNDILLQTAQAYLELQRAAEDLAISQEAQGYAQQLADLTRAYAESGQGLQADADRAAVELTIRKNDVFRSQEGVIVASSRLALLLRLDPAAQLTPIGDAVIPIEVAPCERPIGELVAEGLSLRPEMGENRHLVEEAIARMKRERYAILLPSVVVGASYGAFSGGDGGRLVNIGGRFDGDAIAYWETRNLGFGDAAAREETRSLVRQANAQQLYMMDVIAREIVEAHARIVARRSQINIARQGVEAARASHARNLERIKAVQGLPIEALQSNQALATAERDYLRTVIDYNIAQFTLQRALGWPASLTPALSTSADAP